jgi:alanyl-tRNA synthetase
MADSKRIISATQSPASQIMANQIRQRFVDYFAGRGHTHVPSSSLVPQDDPTLLFVNAGMNQFKDVFTGRESRPYSRAVTVQRCVRAGGKHNDLDNVGFTPRHHTLFEMLGNFSFGDYFKREAIDWAWGFLTEDLGLPKDRLVVTVFDGTGEDAPADDEAVELWAAHVPRGRIYRCSAKDNFWQMGDTGPCGPCSEIHIYKDAVAPATADVPGTGPAHADRDYVELWNLVFMQYEKPGDGTMRPLPKPSIDTGSGLERVAAAVLGAASNYETDLLAPLVDEAKRLASGGAGVPSGVGEAPFRVIADHARATAFLVADGVFPDKAGRSYVLRRIMRRAIRHGADVGLDRPFLHEVCRKVVQMFGDTYPELHERRAVIEEVVRGEEEGFRRTLDRGLRRLRKAMQERAEQGSGTTAFDPAVAAELYDTYGFPIDLTAVILRESSISLDEDAAEAELRARQSDAGGSKLGAGEGIADVYFAVHEQVGDTEFLGYDAEEAEGLVVAILVDGARADEARAGQAVELVLDRSPFYAESGGQVGDTGLAFHTGPGSSAVEVAIEDTIKPRAGMHVHRGVVRHGTVAVGSRLVMQVDRARRSAIRRNHSATHLLHHALRAELGEHVTQKGSLVSPERLRFDFSHNRAITPLERHAIEARVNTMVLGNASSTTKVLTMPEAKAEGAIGLFGEKYGERVRVVRLGDDSVELCGGTHVARAGDIGLFTIVGESSIAQGVRRIEAVTGMGAVAHVQALVDVAAEAGELLHAASASELPERITRLQAELRAQGRTIAELKQKLATGGGGAADDVVEVEGVKLLMRRVPGADAKTLRSAADALRDRLGSGVVVLAADHEGKATLLVAVTKDLEGRLHAGKLVGVLAGHIDGRGGGRPELAQAGGPKLAGIDDALAAAPGALRAQVAGV